MEIFIVALLGLGAVALDWVEQFGSAVQGVYLALFGMIAGLIGMAF